MVLLYAGFALALSACQSSKAKDAASVTSSSVTVRFVGPTLAVQTTASAGVAPTPGVTIVAYLRSDATTAQISAFAVSESSPPGQVGHSGAIPLSETPDYVGKRVRFVMPASATAAELAAFKAELLTHAIVDHVGS